ncbi:MAG: LegC family aminotransferase [Bacteroidetes bacterium]|nr:LegC family aminotransferase [Bacteroidota bacterium]
MFKPVIDFIRKVFDTKEFIPLHEPRFMGNEKKYLEEVIDSTFVSYIGKFVDQFEASIKDYTGSAHAIAMVNGTTALQIAMKLVGVEQGHEVITQPLTFVASSNAITYLGANQVFVDVSKATMGMDPESLERFLSENTTIKDDGFCYNNQSGARISACVPVHIFGHPVSIERIISICGRYNIAVVEDAAESLGSFYQNKHTGTFGKIGVFSFNGNKTITCGGGGMIITDDEEIAKRAKHITTTAKVPHAWEYVHDETGYNLRLPNINAAVACAQMETLDKFLEDKRKLAGVYSEFFKDQNIEFFTEPVDSISNYWLNTVFLKDLDQRNEFLKQTNDASIMTRPVWRLMYKLEMYKDEQVFESANAEWLEARIVNIPSSVRI